MPTLKLKPVPGDSEQRYCCPKCKGTTFENANQHPPDTTAREVRNNGGTWEIRTSDGRKTTFESKWAPASLGGLICLGPCEKEMVENQTMFDLENDGELGGRPFA